MEAMLGITISKEAYEEYLELKKKNTPMQKERRGLYYKYCPVYGYPADRIVPTQNYCDRCGQRLKG